MALKLRSTMKNNKSFRLKESTFEFLTDQAEKEGVSQADVIENALREYQIKQSDTKKKFMDLYNHLCDNITHLEAKRDYPTDGNEGEGLSEDEEATHIFYHKVFDEMRKQPLFSEPINFINK